MNLHLATCRRCDPRHFDGDRLTALTMVPGYQLIDGIFSMERCFLHSSVTLNVVSSHRSLPFPLLPHHYDHQC